MAKPDRAQRFVVIPKGGLPDRSATPPGSRRKSVSRLKITPLPASATQPSAPPGQAPKGPAQLDVVNTSPADGAVLVRAAGLTIDEVKSCVPEGSKVFEEQWYRLDRRARPWSAQNAELKMPRSVSGKTSTWTVTIRLDNDKQTRLKDVLVTVIVDKARMLGVEGKTDRFGRASFVLGHSITRLDAIHLSPLHSAWPLVLNGVKVSATGMEIKLVPLSLREADARGLVYGQPGTDAGRGVKVGIVDTGVGKHKALKVTGGRNTTEESPLRYRDEDGHGSHVAGVIAATASGWRRGEASKVQLFAYRVFQAGEDQASTFAISAAIKQAVVDGCDLINMSIGGGPADGAVRDAIEQAWAKGCVCVAAVGNDSAAQVDYPARYKQCLAVSAIGLQGSWPAGSDVDWTLSDSRGKLLADRETFFASFSNRGKVALTAPGVAVVSTIFGDRWGMMSGTSMATPVVTGLLARRLASSRVMSMPRDARRAAAIAALAKEGAEDLGFSSSMQGDGLAR